MLNKSMMASNRLNEYIQTIIGNNADEQEQIQCIQMLSRLLLEDETVPFEDILHSSVIEKIIELLQNDSNQKLQRESACILSTFASLDFNDELGLDADQQKMAFCDILIKNNAIPILIALISDSDSFWIQGQAIDALGNIADISALMRDIILAENILDILLSICLQSINNAAKKSLLFHASLCLSILCNKQPPPQSNYMLLQCKIINKLLSHYGDNQEVLLNACWSFAYLANALFHEDIVPFDAIISPIKSKSVDTDDEMSESEELMMMYEGRVSKMKHHVRSSLSKVKTSLFGCFTKMQREAERVRDSELLKFTPNRYSQISGDGFFDEYDLELEQKELKYSILRKIMRLMRVDSDDLKHPINKIIKCIATNQISDKDATAILMMQVEGILEDYVKAGNTENVKIANKVCAIIIDQLALNVNIIQSLKQYRIISLLLDIIAMQSIGNEICINVILALLKITMNANLLQVQYIVDSNVVKPLLRLLGEAHKANDVYMMRLIIESLEIMLKICEKSKRENLCIISIMNNDGIEQLDKIAANEDINDELRALVAVKIIAKYDLNGSQMDEIMGIERVPVSADEFMNLNRIQL